MFAENIEVLCSQFASILANQNKLIYKDVYVA